MNNKALFIVSFLIALVLWVHVYISENREITVNVPVALIGEQEGTMAFITPHEAEVTLSVPQSLISKVGEGVHISREVGNYQPGISTIRIQPGDVNAPGYEVLDVSPATFGLDVQPTMVKELRVRPMPIEEPRLGYKVGSITTEPEFVMVEGVRDVLETMDNIQTSYVALDGLYEDQSFTVPFQSYDRIKYVNPGIVTVNVSIVEDNVISSYDSVQVRCMPIEQSGAQPNIQNFPAVSLMVSGRRDLVEAIPVGEPLAYVDCGLVDMWGTYYMKVIPAELSGIKIWGIEPATVPVEVLP